MTDNKLTRRALLAGGASAIGGALALGVTGDQHESLSVGGNGSTPQQTWLVIKSGEAHTVSSDQQYDGVTLHDTAQLSLQATNTLSLTTYE